MPDEERRAAAIKRAQAAHPQFTMDHIASVLDASGLLDQNEQLRAVADHQAAWAVEAMERGLIPGVTPSRLLDDEYEQVEFVVPHDHELCDGCLEHRTEPLFRKVSNTGEPK